MKLHSVGWFCVVCWHTVITLSGLYCTEHPEDEKGSERSEGRVQMESKGEWMFQTVIYSSKAWNYVVCQCEVDLVSLLLLKYGYLDENRHMLMAQMIMNKLQVIGEESKLASLELNCKEQRLSYTAMRYKDSWSVTFSKFIYKKTIVILFGWPKLTKVRNCCVVEQLSMFCENVFVLILLCAFICFTFNKHQPSWKWWFWARRRVRFSLAMKHTC